MNGGTLADQSSSLINREELAATLLSSLDTASKSVLIAASECTFALVSGQLRARVEKHTLEFVAVSMEPEGQCVVPGLEEPPLPFAFKLRHLKPIDIDESRGMRYRREMFVFDDREVVVVLSDGLQSDPRSYLVHRIRTEDDSAVAAHLPSIKGAFWPDQFEVPRHGGLRTEDRWSTSNHRRITRDVLMQLDFSTSAISVVEEGNVYVDRLSNQFNNPQHSMRNIGQPIRMAQEEAESWISSRQTLVLSNVQSAQYCCALFHLGEGLHTIQDRKHGWIFLYQHLFDEIRSDYFHRHEPEAWEMAHKETAEFMDDLLERLRQSAGSHLPNFRSYHGQTCVCDGVKVEVIQ